MHFTMENKPTSTTSELHFWCINFLKFKLKQQMSLMTECLTYLFGIVVQFTIVNVCTQNSVMTSE